MTDYTAADWPHPDAADTPHDDHAPDPAPTPPPSERGWTPAAQASFLEVLSRGATVEVSAHYVGLARSGAYAQRHRDAVFAQGWAAAELLARDCFAEAVTARAIEGYTEVTIWSADRLTRTRHRHDNRLLMATLTRLDAVAEQSHGTEDGDAIRALAADFPGFLDRLRQGSAQAEAHARRHRMTAGHIAAIEERRGKLIQNMVMYGLTWREDRVHAGLPTTDLDAVFEKLCAALAEPPFDWDAATHEEALEREDDDILDEADQAVIFSWPEDNRTRGQALAEAEAEARVEDDENAGNRPLCPLESELPRCEPRVRQL